MIMPIPFILAGIAIGAGLLGVGANENAKDTNEEARKIAKKAKERYEDADALLKVEQKKTEKALLAFGNSKKKVLEGSMQDFLLTFNKIKNIRFKDTGEFNEISKFVIDEQGIIEVQKMTDIYKSAAISGGAAGAAGATIALAASGELALVGGGLSIAGSALMAGEFGLAASVTGSALAFGAAMTPLAAIAGPLVLFSGISADIKADENLEKAKTMRSESNLAVEKMKNSEILCQGIAKKAYMHNDLLVKLDRMFSNCTRMLDVVLINKTNVIGNRKIKSEDLLIGELGLAAVTRALAGAVKAILDTPLLTKDGELSNESEAVYEKTQRAIPQFSNSVKNAETNMKAAKIL